MSRHVTLAIALLFPDIPTKIIKASYVDTSTHIEQRDSIVKR